MSGTNENITPVRRVAFWIVIFLAVVTFFLLVDIFLGKITHTALIRQNSQRFRSEAAYLPLTTKNLVPNIDHKYYDDDQPARTPRSFRTDEYGTIIGPNNNISKEDELVLLFLGGSTTETNEVDEQYRFPALIEKILNDEYGLKVSTRNSGIRGHTVLDSIQLLLNHSTFKSANYVFLMHNINDRLRLATQGGYHVSLSSYAPTSNDNLLMFASSFLNTIWDYISYRSNIIFVIRTRITNFNPFAGETNNPIVSEDSIDFADPHLDSSIDEFKKYLKVFVSTAKAFNQTPILMTQPLGRLSTPQAEFNDVIRDIGEEEDVLVIELDKSLPSDRNWLFLSDDIHLNNDGSTAVAQIIAGKVAKILGSKVEGSNREINSPVDLEVLRNRSLHSPKEGISFKAGPRHILIGRHGRYPSFFSDKKRVLFQAQENDHGIILFYDVTKNEYIRLSASNITYNDRHPVIIDEEKDGSFTIAFGTDRNGTERIYTLEWPSLKTSPLVNSHKIGGAIPARGKHGSVVFAGFGETPDGGQLQIPDLFLYSRLSNKLDRLTQTETEEWRPVISPDGKYVYYIANPNGDFDIFRLSIDTLKIELIYRSEADEWDPSISPDGRWLTFASKQSGTWDIFLLDLESTKSVQLTSGPEDDWDPVFCQDERVISFASSDGDAPRIFGICTFGECKD